MSTNKLEMLLRTLESARLFKVALDTKPCERTGMHMIDEIKNECLWCHAKFTKDGTREKA